MTEPLAVHAENLGHRYRKNWAVRGLNLQAPQGRVYGFLGLNGAGKSTTIRMLMGLIRRQEGTARVLGLDPERDPVRLKRQVGYVAETHNFYEWMTVEEILGFAAHYRPDWDHAFAGDLLRRFGLEFHRESRVGELSKGQRSKVSLLMSLAFRPKLLILDEPTSGLDPSARREFFEGVLAGYQEEGGTIFVSSHLVNEIAGIVDHVGLIHEGRMHLEMPVEELRASVKRVRLTFENEAPAAEIACPGLLKARKDGREALLSVRDFAQNERQLRQVLQTYNPTGIEVEDLNLEDIFVELVGKRTEC